MRVVYANASYRSYDTRGRNAHIGQFIRKTIAQGIEIWMWPGGDHGSVNYLPANRLRRLLTLRRMDVLYVRLQENPPVTCRYALPPFRQLIGSPVVVWEFNTVPEFNLVMGRTQAHVDRALKAFRHYGRGCDLAICVSQALAEYVRSKLGISRVRTVPNGSDPELFRPDAQPVSQFETTGALNVVWIGSAELAWNHFELMWEAANLLHQWGEGHRVAFHVIGTVSDFVNRQQPPPNIHLHGPHAYEVVPSWLAAMDVGLCLYRPGAADFGSPLKLFDYMASGLAVVATHQPQVAEVFAQLDQPDLLVPHDDPVVLAEVLSELERDRGRVQKLGETGRRLVVNFYNWHRAVKDTFQEIESILQERK